MNGEWHQTYAPILHFARGESFFPMAVEDFLAYAALYQAGEANPVVPMGQVRADDLMHPHAGETFLRSVDRGPLSGGDVARSYGPDMLRLLYEWGQNPTYLWTQEVAQSVYEWYSDKTAAATRLFWWNRLLLRPDTARQANLPRFRLPDEVRGAATERYLHSQAGRPRYAYYYRYVPQGGYLNLQYWFFYAYNDWASGFGGFNDHEGDWEGLHLFFHLEGGQRIVEPPAYICYLGHHSRVTKPWDHPDVQRTGNHPHIYVAAGSHASYPERKPYPISSLYGLTDYATGDGETLEAEGWQRRIDLEGTRWVNDYRGSWGTRFWLSLDVLARLVKGVGATLPKVFDLPGVSAPRGPRYDDAGNDRETWANAARFAGLIQ